MSDRFAVDAGTKLIAVFFCLLLLLNVAAVIASGEYSLGIVAAGALPAMALVGGLSRALWRGSYWALSIGIVYSIVLGISLHTQQEMFAPFIVGYLFCLWAMFHLWDRRKTRIVEAVTPSPKQSDPDSAADQ